LLAVVQVELTETASLVAVELAVIELLLALLVAVRRPSLH
jgi:hypothetical protein